MIFSSFRAHEKWFRVLFPSPRVFLSLVSGSWEHDLYWLSKYRMYQNQFAFSEPCYVILCVIVKKPVLRGCKFGRSCSSDDVCATVLVNLQMNSALELLRAEENRPSWPAC